jgi:prepilin-type N-terminal cleavage/methylation domain-containing protein
LFVRTLRKEETHVFRRAAALARRGVTLLEMISVAVVLGVLAAIIVPNVVTNMGLSKAEAFGTTIAEVQAASDRFYGVAGAYPTYTGSTVANQPGACPDAFEIVPTAQDPSGQPFVGAYLRQPPSASAAAAGLILDAGSQVYYGVATGGLVFATQAPPEVNGDEWNLGGTPVYTQTNNAPQAFTTLGNLCSGVQTQVSSSLVTGASVSGSTLTLSGNAPPNSTVTITQVDPGETKVQADGTGAYTASVTLDNIPNVVVVSDGPYAAELILGAGGRVVQIGSGGALTALQAPPPTFDAGAEPASYVCSAPWTSAGYPDSLWTSSQTVAGYSSGTVPTWNGATWPSWASSADWVWASSQSNGTAYFRIPFSLSSQETLTFYVQGAADVWIPSVYLDGVQEVSSGVYGYTLSFTATVPAGYHALAFSATADNFNSKTTFGVIAAVEQAGANTPLWTSAGSTVLTDGYVTPTEGCLVPAGSTATASPSSSSPPSNAIDGSTATTWSSVWTNDTTLTVQFPSPTQVSSVDVFDICYTTSTQFCSHTLQVYANSNGSWVKVGTQNVQPTTQGQYYRFSVPTGSYSGIRIEESNFGGSGYAGTAIIGDVEINY